MEADDRVLLQRFAERGDGEAFSQLTSRYASLVYSTCRRVLGNTPSVDDAVQETFVQLMRNASNVHGSLGAWLHTVATRRSLDLLRQDASRRQREQAYVSDIAQPPCGSWGDAAAHVDAALQEIPGPSRELVVQYFLERRTMTQMAAAHGMSQPTISRRVAEAVETLRARLRDHGYAFGAVPLQGLLANCQWEAPPDLVVSLSSPAAVAPVPAGIGSAASVAAPAAGHKALFVSFGVLVVASTAWTIKEHNVSNDLYAPPLVMPAALGINPAQGAEPQVFAGNYQTEQYAMPAAASLLAVDHFAGTGTRVPSAGLPVVRRPASPNATAAGPVTGQQPTAPPPQLPRGTPPVQVADAAPRRQTVATSPLPQERQSLAPGVQPARNPLMSQISPPIPRLSPATVPGQGLPGPAVAGSASTLKSRVIVVRPQRRPTLPGNQGNPKKAFQSDARGGTLAK
jgi:RNA polymerase sigma factor (sigma-70 family)